MTKHFNLKNALEQMQDDLTDIQQAPPVSQEEADISEDFIDDDLHESDDLSEDIDSLATASESLESLANALEQDLFPGHTASNTEIQSVKFALESYGLEDDANPVKADETKKSLKDRVVAGAKAVWDWLMGIGTKIAAWVSEVFTRMTKPVMTYEKRMAEVVKKSKDGLKTVSGDSYTKQLHGGKKLDVAVKDLATFVSTVATANNSVAASVLLSKIEKSGGADGREIVNALNEMQKGFLKAYPNEVNGKYFSHVLIGGNVFMMDVGSETKIDWDHKHEQKKGDKGPAGLTTSDIASLASAVKDGVSAWKSAQSSVANMKIDKVAADIKRIGKSYKGELSPTAKDALRVMPKMLKSPAIDASMVLAKTLGAAVSFAEAHVSVSLKDRASEAGSSVKDKASSVGKSISDRYDKFRNKDKGSVEKTPPSTETTSSKPAASKPASGNRAARRAKG